MLSCAIPCHAVRQEAQHNTTQPQDITVQEAQDRTGRRCAERKRENKNKIGGKGKRRKICFFYIIFYLGLICCKKV
jgi:hypothetical protein